MIDHDRGPRPTYTQETDSLFKRMYHAAGQLGQATVGLTVSMIQGSKDNFHWDTTLINPRNW